MNIVAVIPAKGVSKRLPGKNVRDMLGKPLIAWSIEAAKKSKKITRVIVATDSKEIAQIAKKYGAETPFSLPSEITNDDGNIVRVLSYTADWLTTHEKYTVDAFVLLQSPNPLKRPTDLDAAITLFQDSGADSVISVSPALGNKNPHWVLTRGADGSVTLFNGNSLKQIITKSQDLPPCYSRNDVIYVLKPANVRESPPNLYGDHVELYEMDELFDTDINIEEDWNITEDKLRRLLAMGTTS